MKNKKHSLYVLYGKNKLKSYIPWKNVAIIIPSDINFHL